MGSNGVEEQASEDEDKPAVIKSGRASRNAAAGGRGKRHVLDSSVGEDDEEDDGEKVRAGQSAGAGAKKSESAAESDQSHGSVVNGSSPLPSSFGGLGFRV
jgi:hypothetical protein